MEWFKELSLIEKIETYGELMFSIGVGSGDLEKMKEELGEMHYYITKDVEKKINNPLIQ